MTTPTTAIGALLALMGACTMEPGAPPEAAASGPAPQHAPGPAEGPGPAPGSLPACALRHEGGAYVALVTAAGEAVAGDYALRLRGPGLGIEQGGPFEARAGETVVLGRAGVGPVPEAELTLHLGDRVLHCPGEG